MTMKFHRTNRSAFRGLIFKRKNRLGGDGF